MTGHILFDELDERWDENGYCEEDDIDMNTEFELLFNDKEDGNQYIVYGIHGLWDGPEEIHYPNIYASLHEAIADTTEGFGVCYLLIYELDDGELKANVTHHDGVNHMTIKKLTEKGKEQAINMTIREILKDDELYGNVNLLSQLNTDGEKQNETQ